MLMPPARACTGDLGGPNDAHPCQDAMGTPCPACSRFERTQEKLLRQRAEVVRPWHGVELLVGACMWAHASLARCPRVAQGRGFQAQTRTLPGRGCGESWAWCGSHPLSLPLCHTGLTGVQQADCGAEGRVVMSCECFQVPMAGAVLLPSLSGLLGCRSERAR